MSERAGHLEAVLATALEHHRGGRLPQAESLYRQILQTDPRHADALHLLGLLAYQVGRHSVAVDLIRQALVVKPNYPEAYGNLGCALKELGQREDAVAAFRQAIALGPELPQAYFNLAGTLKDMGRVEDVIAVYRAVIARHPGLNEAHYQLGDALMERHQFQEAVQAYAAAIALAPERADAYNNFGNALIALGRAAQAAEAYRRAIALNPSFAQAHNNLGNVLRELGETEAAAASLQAAIALKPDLAEAHNNLGNILRSQNQLSAALAEFERAIAIKPELAEAHNNMANTLTDQGRLDEAISAYRRALELKPDYAAAHSDLLLALHYCPGLDAQAIAQEHRAWDRRHGAPLARFIRPHDNERDPERRLRIGYISPDFRQHPVGRFLLPLLAHHDKRQVELFAYAEHRAADGLTEKLRACADWWRVIEGIGDGDVAEMIRQDRIDILVDLAGHTVGNRLLVLVRKPAPVQVTYLGYPDTTGMAAVDYRLTDEWADPHGRTEQFHSEELVRLGGGMWCYGGDADAPDVGALPAAAGAGITFGCFNQWPKINRQVLGVWARLLKQVSGSTLLMRAFALDSAELRGEMLALFAAEGVDARRVRIVERAATHGAHLAACGQVDIALDPFPYNGTMSTCEALWMGVPVVTLAGATHAGRVGVSLLTQIGLGELVARTAEDYVRIAAELAGDLQRLAELRRTLRERMQGSALMDGRRLAREVEAAYRRMWRTYCGVIAG